MPSSREVVPEGVVERDDTLSRDAMRWRPRENEPRSPEGAGGVSGAPALTRIEQTRQFIHLVAEHARMPLHAPERPALTVRIFEHKAALFARIATEQPTEQHHELAQTARRQLTEARHRYAPTVASEPSVATPFESEESAHV